MNDEEFIPRVSRLIAEREIVASRWTLGLSALYFFGTLASVWVLVSEEVRPLRDDLNALRGDIKELRAELVHK